MQPGETQRWRIANVSSDTFFFLALQGHMFYEIADDGNPYDQVVAFSELLLWLPPSALKYGASFDEPGNVRTPHALWGLDYQAQPDVLIATSTFLGIPSIRRSIAEITYPVR